MKLYTTLGITMFICSNAFSQIAPPPPPPVAPDTVEMEEIYMDTLRSIEEMEMPTPAVPYYDEMSAYPVEGDYQMPSFNVFKNNSKLKPEEKPDKKASYSGSTRELLMEIAQHLTVPYSYANNNKYVIIQFIVGKDSLLYNPQVLYTPGAEYSINATKAIESLQLHFTPATKNGKPVDSILIIPIRFSSGNNYADIYGKG